MTNSGRFNQNLLTDIQSSTAASPDDVRADAPADDRRADIADTHLTPGQVREAQSAILTVLDTLESAIFGQRELLEMMVIGLLSRGHLLIEGPPGIGKTTLVRSLSTLVGLEFRRLQMTPDLLPADVLGGSILEEREGDRRLSFHRGPIFANIILADEINRATPRIQSVLFEAMQEHRVTVVGETHALPSPFLVVATLNSTERDSESYLPVAQRDRFVFKLNIERASLETLERIVAESQDGHLPFFKQIWSTTEFMHLFDVADAVLLPCPITNYIARLVTSTHPDGETAPEEVRKYVRFGASTRAAIAVATAARAAAVLRGSVEVDVEDVRRVAYCALRHRLVIDEAAQSAGWTAERIVQQVLNVVPERVDG